MSEKPTHEYSAGSTAGRSRAYSHKPVGPVEGLVLSLGCDLHDTENPNGSWLDIDEASAASFCRRAVEARGRDWDEILEAINAERLHLTPTRH